MQNYDFDEYLKKIDKEYTDKFKLATKCIDEKLSDKIKFKLPSGGINFFLELPRGYSSVDFTTFLLKKGVSILPGSNFSIHL